MVWFEDEFREMKRKQRREYEDKKAQMLWDIYNIKYADLVRIDYLGNGAWQERDNTEGKVVRIRTRKGTL